MNNNSNILNELLTTNVMSVEKLKEEFTKFINSLVIDVNEDNVAEYKKNATELNKFATEFNKRAIAWEKEQTKDIKNYRQKLNEFKKIADEKREEIKIELNKFEEIEKQKRVNICKEYYLTQKENYDIFDWINFDEHIYEKTFENAGALTSKGKITKKVTDVIDSKLQKFSGEKIVLSDKIIALTEYKRNGYNLGEALKYAELVEEQQREQERLKKAKENAKEEILSERVEKIVEEVKTEAKESIVEEKTTTTFVVEIPNEAVNSFANMLISKNIKFKKEEK